MSGESVKIPVEYIITTTSDWTIFHIVEGGSWSKGKIECLKGCDRLRQAVFEDDVIVIKKVPQDITLVEVKAKCTMDIDEKHLDSQISHLITKGDLKSTTVKIIVQGKEIGSETNSNNIAGDPDNPKPFKVSASKYVSAFQKRATKIDYDKLESRANKCRKYERIIKFVGDYALLLVLLPLFLWFIYAQQTGREFPMPIWEVIPFMGIGIAIYFITLHVFSNKAKKYRLDDDEWATFYTHSILDNLENSFNAKTTGLKRDYRKKALENTKDFLSCIEKKWKVSSFKLVKTYVGDAISNLKKNIRYRVIPSLKDEKDESIIDVEQIMRNFLTVSRSLDLKGINSINKQMSSKLNAIKSVGFRDRLSTFLNAHGVLKHGLATVSLVIGCGVFYYIVVSYGDIPKEYVFTVTGAGFLSLLALYFRKQPKE